MLMDFSTDQWLISLSFNFTLAFLCGYIADRIMGYAGFGVIGNWLLLAAGSLATLYFYNLAGYRFEWYPQWAFAVAMAGSTVTLMGIAVFKSVARV